VPQTRAFRCSFAQLAAECGPATQYPPVVPSGSPQPASPFYFGIQRIAALVAEAAAPRPADFNPELRLRQELKRVLRDISEGAIPELRDAVLSGAAVGPVAQRWLPVVREWLETGCKRTEV
jgi:hypothetical protein